MDIRIARHLVCAYLLYVLLGCAHHPPQVDCDGILQPINSRPAVQTEPTSLSGPSTDFVAQSSTGASAEEGEHGR